MDHLSATFAALSDPTRRAILDRLSAGEASFTVIAEPFEMSKPAVVKHLRALERAGLVIRTGAKARPVYSLAADRLKESRDWLDRYETFWTGALDRLDAYVAEIQSQKGRIGVTPDDAAPVSERTGPDALRIVRQFNASREVLWLMFSDPAHMRRWWGPSYVTCTACSADLRVGGAWSISMEGDEGQLYHIEGFYREVLKPERLVYTWAWRSDEGLGPESIVTLTFTEDGPAHTILTLTHTELSENMTDSHLTGWESVFDRLAGALADMG